jgi:hypothetical protein
MANSHDSNLGGRRYITAPTARRTALCAAALFVAVATVYWFLTYDAGGSFLIGMVGTTLGIASYALLRGSAGIY